MDDEVKKILERNLKLTEEIYKMTKSIKSYVIWERIFSFIKILFIVVPIVLGIIYLPPLLKNIVGQYKDLLGIESGESGNIRNLLKGGSDSQNLKDIDIDKLPPEVQKYLE